MKRLLRQGSIAVLHQGPVKSPVDAVRAAIVAEHKR
jgi:methylmalonyl-CoA mutase cobalamin-binding subunit